MLKLVKKRLYYVSVRLRSRLEVKKALDSSKVEDALNRFERYETKIDGLESQMSRTI